ncbi:unnamed protein product, partial [marine sediment metagenome]
MGGIIYAIIATSDIPLVGSGFIVWAFVGALFACYIKWRGNFHVVAKIYTILGMIGTFILIIRLFAHTNAGMAGTAKVSISGLLV